MQLGVTANTQHLCIERRPILPITDVMQLETLLRSALLAAIAGTDKRRVSDNWFELTSHCTHRI